MLKSIYKIYDDLKQKSNNKASFHQLNDDYVILKESDENEADDNQNNDDALPEDLKKLIHSFINPSKNDLPNDDVRDCLKKTAIKSILKEPFSNNVDQLTKNGFMESMGSILKRDDVNDDINNYISLFKRKLVTEIFLQNQDKYDISKIDFRDWNVLAQGVSIKESEEPNVFASYVYEKFLTAAGLIAATIKTPNTETYNWAVNTDGRIIFSNNAENIDKKVVNVSWTFDDNGELTPVSTLTDVDNWTVKLREFLGRI